MLPSKRVNYQCMFIADFSGETCMYSHPSWLVEEAIRVLLVRSGSGQEEPGMVMRV